MVAWQMLGNSDPVRDHVFIGEDCLVLDGTIKFFRENGFSRRWPNVVCSAGSTISTIDEKWEKLGIGPFIHSPSLKFRKLERGGREELLPL
jgi:4-hydroxy-3-polyprenylbenzoate decarboxylase